MHSRSFQNAFRTSLRACVAASCIALSTHAEACVPPPPVVGACFLHDSGMEFIPSRLLPPDYPIDPLGSYGDAPYSSSDSLDANPFEDDRVDTDYFDCERIARQNARQAELSRWLDRTQSDMNAWFHAASADASLMITRWSGAWTANIRDASRWIAMHVTLPEVSDLDCPWDRSFHDALIADAPATAGESFADLGASESFLGTRSPNIFVFTLESITSGGTNVELNVAPTTGNSDVGSYVPAPSPSDRVRSSLAGTAFARDYCVFAPYPLDSVDTADFGSQPEAAIASRPPQLEDPAMHDAADVSILALQQQAGIRLQRDASRALAKRLNWLGSALLQWSSELESSVRIAEAGDGPGLRGIK